MRRLFASGASGYYSLMLIDGRAIHVQKPREPAAGVDSWRTALRGTAIALSIAITLTIVAGCTAPATDPGDGGTNNGDAAQSHLCGPNEIPGAQCSLTGCRMPTECRECRAATTNITGYAPYTPVCRCIDRSLYCNSEFHCGETPVFSDRDCTQRLNRDAGVRGGDGAAGGDSASDAAAGD